MQFNALLIGCGRIGGTLDLNSNRVFTWAKGLHCDPQAHFAVYDADRDKAALLARHYSVDVLESLSHADLSSFDVAIIASPTQTHREMVRMAMAANVRLIVCEKPVADSVKDLEALEQAYAEFRGRIMVNFHRRFQPGFAKLRRRIAQIEAAEKCTSVVVKYQRGFHNNASHALDLLEYLFDRRISLKGSVVTRTKLDEFDADPTMTAITRWEQAQICWIGLTDLRASHLEIEVFFERSAIFLLNGGDNLRYLTSDPQQDGYYPAFALASEQTGVMRDWLANVLNHVKLMLENSALPDNFIQSIDISRRILELQKAAKCQI